MAKTPISISDADRELLTEEELAGLEDDSLVDEGEGDDDGDGDGADDDKSGTTGAADEEDAAAKKAEEDAAAAKAKEDADKAAADEAAAKAAEQTEQPVKPVSVLPQYEAPDAAKIKELDDRIAELDKKYDEAELTAEEWRAQSRQLEAERRELDKQSMKAELAKEAAEHAIKATETTWYDKTVPDWLKSHPEYAPGSAKYAALEHMVKELQGKQPDNQFDASILNRADAAVRKELGLPPREQKQPARKRDDPPPTLAHMPSADVDDVSDGDEFAAIERLKGVAYEEALAKMSDEARERYLAR
jgi:hypothetical protein